MWCLGTTAECMDICHAHMDVISLEPNEAGLLTEQTKALHAH